MAPPVYPFPTLIAMRYKCNKHIIYLSCLLDSNARDEDLEKQAIQQFEAAFERIKSAKGEQDIEKIVHDFIKGEEQNFALYNYVSTVYACLQ